MRKRLAFVALTVVVTLVLWLLIFRAILEPLFPGQPNAPPEPLPAPPTMRTPSTPLPEAERADAREAAEATGLTPGQRRSIWLDLLAAEEQATREAAQLDAPYETRVQEQNRRIQDRVARVRVRHGIDQATEKLIRAEAHAFGWGSPVYPMFEFAPEQ